MDHEADGDTLDDNGAPRDQEGDAVHVSEEDADPGVKD